MSSTPKTEQERFDQALAETSAELDEVAKQALIEAAEGLEDPSRDDTW